MTAFVDTYAFLALLDRREVHYDTVRRFLDDTAGRWVTSEWVLLELADGCAKPDAKPYALSLIATVRTDPRFQVIGFEPQIYDRAYALYAARADKAWSLTDCTSFTIMAAFAIVDALTADRHFAQAGFRPVFNTP